MHYGDLKWKEVQKGGNAYTPMADSFCYTAEINLTL